MEWVRQRVQRWGSAAILIYAVACLPPVAPAQRPAEPLHLPAVAPLHLPAELPKQHPPALETPGKVIPINLDTLLHLAQDQNAQVNLARAKLDEAFAEKSVADKYWLPEVWAGVSYFRHEGGIVNPDGTFVHSSFGTLFAGVEVDAKLDLREAIYRKVDAERKVWQQKGEVSRMTNETLLDAATTYIDLLAARSGEAVALEVEGNLNKLLEKARKLAATDPGIRVEADNVAADLAGQQLVVRQMRQAAAAASARLKYLLGLDPCAELIVMDPQIVPLKLVDADRPTCDLVNEALANGPGVYEMEGLLALIQSAMEKARGPGRFMPTFGVCAEEGLFGGGPGDDPRYDNRLDMRIYAKWNVTELFTARDKERAALAKQAQAHFGYQDLRGRLTMGVEEARAVSQSSAAQLPLARQQIEFARAAHKASDYRLTNLIKGATPSEVRVSVAQMGGAQANYLRAMREMDKAQLRLMILTGAGGGGRPHHP
jgi:outer membrane protein TolC